MGDTPESRQTHMKPDHQICRCCQAKISECACAIMACSQCNKCRTCCTCNEPPQPPSEKKPLKISNYSRALYLLHRFVEKSKDLSILESAMGYQCNDVNLVKFTESFLAMPEVERMLDYTIKTIKENVKKEIVQKKKSAKGKT